MSGFLESFLTRGWWVVCLEVSFTPCWHLGSSLPLSPSLVLFAMKEDNEKVPTLLTDYILKGESSPRGPWSRASRRPLPREPTLLRSLPGASCQPKPRRGEGQGPPVGEWEALTGMGFCCCMLPGGRRRRFLHPGVPTATPQQSG